MLASLEKKGKDSIKHGLKTLFFACYVSLPWIDSVILSATQWLHQFENLLLRHWVWLFPSCLTILS